MMFAGLDQTSTGIFGQKCVRFGPKIFHFAKSAFFPSLQTPPRPVSCVGHPHFNTVFTTLFQQVDLDQNYLVLAC